MGIDFSTTGNGDSGPIGNVSGYSLTIDALSLDGTDQAAAAPDATISINQGSDIDIARLVGDSATLTDTEARGSIVGRITAIDDNPGGVSVTMDSILSRLVGTITMDPFTGTLGDYLASIAIRADESATVIIQGDLGATAVTLPGNTDTAWAMIKDLSSAYQFDVSMVGQAIAFRSARSATISYDRVSDVSHSIEQATQARGIEVTYLNSEWVVDGRAFPRAGHDRPTTIISGPSGSIIRASVETPGTFLSEISPATVITPGEETPGETTYVVMDGAGNVVTPSDWTGAGGRVTVSIGADPETVDVVMRIPRGMVTGPYSLARPAGTHGETENSLFVYGTGTYTTPTTMMLLTGADEVTTVEEVGSSVASPLYQGAAEAYTAALAATMRFSGAPQAVRISTPVVGVIALGSEWGGYTFSDFNADLSGQTFTSFNTAHSGQTFAQYGATLESALLDSYSNRIFEVAPGARLNYGWSNYRVIQVATTEEGYVLDCVQDVICQDVETLWSGSTCAEVEAAYASESVTCAEFSAMPLYLPGA